MNNKKKPSHYHIWDLPKDIFPRTKESMAKSYAEDVGRLYQGLSFTNKKVQEASCVAVFHIKAITSKGGYNTSPEEVFPAIEDFVYHYENFCHRTYILREKLLQFINSVLPVGYKDDQVKINHLIINPVIKISGILTEIEKFNKRKALGKIISDRKSLTHRLYYKDVDHYLRPKTKVVEKDAWFKEWSKEIVGRSQMANSAMSDLSSINHSLSEKIILYRKAVK